VERTDISVGVLAEKTWIWQGVIEGLRVYQMEEASQKLFDYNPISFQNLEKNLSVRLPSPFRVSVASRSDVPIAKEG
jgi:hypothetical protein